MRFNNIIFDFDGTLVDSRPGIVKTFKRVIKELTSKKISDQKIVQLIGFPLAQMISILLNTNDQTLINRGSELFKEYYGKEGLYQNIVYPGIREMLGSFKNQSHQPFVISNKIDLFMNKILEQHNLKKYFIAVLGTKGTDMQSKKPDQVKYLLTHHKLKKQETVMVGDTENDIAAARRNFIYSIGITWGYGLERSLVKAKADAICHTPLELQQFIEKTKNGNKKTT